MNNTYSYLKSIVKAVKFPIIVGLGFLLAGFVGNYPEYANLTVGGLLILVYDWLKHKLGVKLP